MSSSARQLERMLALVPYLQVNEGIPVAELAERFGVSTARIAKEVSSLAMTGTRSSHAEMIGIDYDSLEDGYAFIRNADFMPRPLRLTVLEGASLVAALGVLRQMADIDQVEIIDRVTTKLHSALSTKNSNGVAVHVNAPAEDLRASLNAAMRDGLQVEIEYASEHSDSVSSRIIDPLTITLERGSAYLTAWCHRAEDHRIFRLDRVNSLRVLESEIQAQPPRQPLELFDFETRGTAAILEVSPDARWIIEPCDSELISEGTGGTQTVRVHVADLQWLLRLVLLAGTAIRVVEPRDLAEQVRAAARSALTAYDRS